MNEEATNKELVKFCQSRFENRIQGKKFESLFKKYFHYNKQVVCLQVEDWSDHIELITFQVTIMLILIRDFRQKPNFGKTHGILIALFYMRLWLLFSYKGFTLLPKN